MQWTVKLQELKDSFKLDTAEGCMLRQTLIRRALCDTDAKLRRACLCVLPPTAPDADERAEILRHGESCLEDPDAEVRCAAIECLRRSSCSPQVLGTMAPAIARRLEDEDAHVRSAAACALGCCSSETLLASILAIRALLSDHVDLVREAAVGAIAALGLEQFNAEIGSCLSDTSALVRLRAFHSVGSWSREQQQLLSSHISKGLKDSDARVRRAAVELICTNSGLVSDLGSQLALLLKDPELSVRRKLVTAFDKMPVSERASIVAGLPEMLKDDRWHARDAARDVFGLLSLPEQTALYGVVLEMCCNGTDSDLRQAGLQLALELDETLMHRLLGEAGALSDDADEHVRALWVALVTSISSAVTRQEYRTHVSRLVADNSAMVRLRAVEFFTTLPGMCLTLAEHRAISGLVGDADGEVHSLAVRVLGDGSVAPLELQAPTGTGR